MSSVFYNKYRSLFFDDKDPEPISYQYLNSKPKNYLNLYPSSNIMSLAQHYNILPKEYEIPKPRLEEVQNTSYMKPQLLQKLDPLPYKPVAVLDYNPKIPALEYNPEPQSPPKRALSVQKLPPIVHEYNKNSAVEKSDPKPLNPYQEALKYEHTKNNIFPEKPEGPKPINYYQEAVKRRKEAKNKLSDRRQRLIDLLKADINNSN
jgi:hypothetical protein